MEISLRIDRRHIRREMLVHQTFQVSDSARFQVMRESLQMRKKCFTIENDVIRIHAYNTVCLRQHESYIGLVNPSVCIECGCKVLAFPVQARMVCTEILRHQQY